MFEYIKNAYDRFWAFFKNSGTIFFARMTALVGFVVASLAAMDWSTLVNFAQNTAGFSKAQILWTFGLVTVQGIFAEIVRRSNTNVVDNTLISKSTSTVAVKAIKKPGKLKKVKTV